MKALLLDIEGTVAPLDFVHGTLFPYSAERMADFVANNFNALSVTIELLASEARSDPDAADRIDFGSPREVAEYLNELIARDRKSTALKEIQGQIWRSGFENGELKAPLFDDVPGALARSRGRGELIAIFSSGSILAQRLFFSHTTSGDLSGLVDAYFDTTTGPKREPSSYIKIAEELGTGPADIFFVSDIPAELDAAAAAGLRTALALRPGNAVINDPGPHRCIGTLDDLE